MTWSQGRTRGKANLPVEGFGGLPDGEADLQVDLLVEGSRGGRAWLRSYVEWLPRRVWTLELDVVDRLLTSTSVCAHGYTCGFSDEVEERRGSLRTWFSARLPRLQWQACWSIAGASHQPTTVPFCAVYPGLVACDRHCR